MPFMLRYADLFGKSEIIQKIMPKSINNAEELEEQYPSLLTEGSSQASKDMQLTKLDEFKLADIDAINKVSSPRFKIKQATGIPIYDLLERGGKQWRPLLGMMFAECLGRDLANYEENKDIYFACGLTEIVHNGSLMIDDIEDGSHMRRGDLCSHKKFGVDVAVNAGNFMYLAPMNKINNFVHE